jgi:trans-aconitate methyltransferase
MSRQIWNVEDYAAHGRFAADHGGLLLEMLGAQPDEHILDLGCGDGALTKKIADLGCKVTGLDSSPQLAASARKLGLHVVESDVYDMGFSSEFDAVFSHGALHWMKDADCAIGRVAQALRPKGRFVAAMSGHNSIRPLHEALIGELDRRGYDGQSANPWYFPTAEDYAARLGAAGFEVEYIDMSPDPILLPGDVMVWLVALGSCFTAALPEEERADYLQCVRQRIETHACEAGGRLTAGAFPLRFKARLRT